MSKPSVFEAIAIVVGVMLLRLIFSLDESHIIVYIAGGIVFLIKLIQDIEKRRQSQNTILHAEPPRKRAVLMPMEHDGKSYTYLENMPPNVRRSYDNFIASLNKVHPDGLELLLSKIGREDVMERLKHAEEMKATGLISEEEFAATKKQLLTYGE